MKNIDNGHSQHNLVQEQKVLTMNKLKTGEQQRRRHKCSICGRVRYERNMKEILGWRGVILKTRYGNTCWACDDDQNCRQEAIYFQPY